MLASEHDDPTLEDAAPDVAAVRISSVVMVAAVIFLFMVVVFVFVLYLYARHFLRPNRPRSRSRFVFAAADFGPANTRRGLDPAVLRALPVTLYRAAEFKEPLECAVCLSELADGEEARVLPKCGHGFHLECIDMWFHSHSTCPLCRCPVAKPNPEEEASTASAEDHSVDAPAVFPTNVLVCGSQDRFNTGSAATAVAGSEEGASSSLVIEIPRRVMDGFPSPVSESKSPLSARFRSLRKLWSQGRRGAGPSCSPREGDIEQGVGGSAEGSSLPPKSP